MARGSEQATWAWADDVRHCDTCGNHLRIKDVGLFQTIATGERTIRCQDCVELKRARFVTGTRRLMGLA